MFSQVSSDGPIHFYPAQEFLENGKFKLPKVMRTEMTELAMEYPSYYQTKLLSQNVGLLNFGSIAQVCNLQDE